MLADRYRAVLARAAHAAKASGRDPRELTLVAVSKGQPASAVRALYDLGQRDFGESRAIELAEKARALPSDVRWHYLGALQSNKLRDLKPLVARVHSWDRADLAPAWAGGPPVLAQVNVGDEPQKRGVPLAQAEALVAELLEAGLACDGVMTLPPASDDPERTRAHFRAVRTLRDALAARWPAVREVSAGMSGDYHVAIEEGATILRVGTAIFGERRVT